MFHNGDFYDVPTGRNVLEVNKSINWKKLIIIMVVALLVGFYDLIIATAAADDFFICGYKAVPIATNDFSPEISKGDVAIISKPHKSIYERGDMIIYELPLSDSTAQAIAMVKYQGRDRNVLEVGSERAYYIKQTDITGEITTTVPCNPAVTNIVFSIFGIAAINTLGLAAIVIALMVKRRKE